jgi:hypothetical protein
MFAQRKIYGRAMYRIKFAHSEYRIAIGGASPRAKPAYFCEFTLLYEQNTIVLAYFCHIIDSETFEHIRIHDVVGSKYYEIFIVGN